MTNLWDLITKIFRTDGDVAVEARDRLRMVIKQDRVKITPEAMEEMKQELIKALSEYLEVEPDKLDLKIDSDGTATALIANIPIKGGRAEVIGKRVPAVEQSQMFDTPPAEKPATKTKKKAAPRKKVVKTPTKRRTKARGVSTPKRYHPGTKAESVTADSTDTK